MVGIDLDTEIREYQWRRKFERPEQRRVRMSIIAPMLLVMLVCVKTCLAYW